VHVRPERQDLQGVRQRFDGEVQSLHEYLYAVGNKPVPAHILTQSAFDSAKWIEAL
jgi:hypothetical protein